MELAAHSEESPAHLFSVTQTSTSRVILAFSAQVEETLKAGFKSFWFGVEIQ